MPYMAQQPRQASWCLLHHKHDLQQYIYEYAYVNTHMHMIFLIKSFKFQEGLRLLCLPCNQFVIKALEVLATDTLTTCLVWDTTQAPYRLNTMQRTMDTRPQSLGGTNLGCVAWCLLGEDSQPGAAHGTRILKISLG
jgi:hypothetical protein